MESARHDIVVDAIAINIAEVVPKPRAIEPTSNRFPPTSDLIESGRRGRGVAILNPEAADEVDDAKE